MIRALLFDIGNVLVPFDPRLALERLIGKTSYSCDQMTAQLRQWSRIVDFECGRIETEQFFSDVCFRLRLVDLSLGRFMEIWSGIFLDEMLVSPETIRSLGKRCRLLLLSNTNAMHFSFVQKKFPVLNEFDEAVLSFRVGVMKPDPGIFLEAIARAGCPAHESFYVDDIEENVLAARSLGIHSVRFESEAQLLGELREHGMALET